MSFPVLEMISLDLPAQRQPQRSLRTNPIPLVSSYIFTFPELDALGSLKSLFFVLSFLCKFFVLCCRCSGSQSSQLPR